MFDFFEQPWTLTGAAILVLFGVFTFRSVWPEKRHWWQWLLPIFVISIAFGLDALVKTDMEKVNTVIKVAMKAVQEKDFNAIEAVIADNYYDTYHNSKEHLMADCRQYLSRNPVKKNKKTGILVKLSPPNATVHLFTVTTLDESSPISQRYKSFFFVKVEVRLRKQSNKNWLISRIEIAEIDRQPAGWRYIRAG
jgi:hypothetical protein